MAEPKPKKPDNLNAALLAAQRGIEEVSKDSKNSYHGYDYVSSEAMIGECRGVLHLYDLVLFETGIEIDTFADKIVFVRVFYCLRHAPSGEAMEWNRAFPVVPDKGRPVDKAFAGALTTGLNYTLRGLLMIPRLDSSDDMDHSSRDDSKRRTSNRAAPAPEHRPPSTPSTPSTARTDLSCPKCNAPVKDQRYDPVARRKNWAAFSCSNRTDCDGMKNGYPWSTYDHHFFEAVAPARGEANSNGRPENPNYDPGPETGIVGSDYDGSR